MSSSLLYVILSATSLRESWGQEATGYTRTEGSKCSSAGTVCQAGRGVACFQGKTTDAQACGKLCDDAAWCRHFYFGARLIDNAGEARIGECWLESECPEGKVRSYSNFDRYAKTATDSIEEVSTPPAAPDVESGMAIAGYDLSENPASACDIGAIECEAGTGMECYLSTSKTVQSCADACANSVQCKQFVFGKKDGRGGECWLESACSRAVENNDFDRYIAKTATTTTAAGTTLQDMDTAHHGPAISGALLSFVLAVVLP